MKKWLDRITSRLNADEEKANEFENNGNSKLTYGEKKKKPEKN